jgi:hypothetical protein
VVIEMIFGGLIDRDVARRVWTPAKSFKPQLEHISQFFGGFWLRLYF